MDKKLYSYEQAPLYKSDAEATTKGWEDPDTGEVLVAIRNMSNRQIQIDEIVPAEAEYVQETEMSISITFNTDVEFIDDGDPLVMKLKAVEYDGEDVVAETPFELEATGVENDDVTVIFTGDVPALVSEATATVLINDELNSPWISHNIIGVSEARRPYVYVNTDFDVEITEA